MNMFYNDSSCVSDLLHEFQSQHVSSTRQETSVKAARTENERK